MLEFGFWHWLTYCARLHHVLAYSATCICLAHATFPPHCHLFCHGELLSAVSAVSIVFCRWSVSPTGGDGCLMKNDRPKNLNGQLGFRFTGGLIGAQPQFVLLLMEKHHRGETNVCLCLEADKPSILVSQHIYFLTWFNSFWVMLCSLPVFQSPTDVKAH